MIVSVCMATYNGQLYLKDQIASILSEIGSSGELIIVDDCSTDSTVSIIKSFTDSRIKLYLNPQNLGHVKSFARAIEKAVGEYIFLADQDDVWRSGRVQLIIEAMIASKACVAASNFSLIDGSGIPLEARRHILSESASIRHFQNLMGIFLGTRPYFGCAMAMKNSMRSLILPVPSCVESHDLWIATAGNLLRSIRHISEHTLDRRIHNSNLTIPRGRPLLKKIKSRIISLQSIVILLLRMAKKNAIKLF